MRAQRIVALVLFVAGCVAVRALERRGVPAEISPRPVLYLIADTEQEAERIPLAVTRVSDSEEIKVGQEMAEGYGLTSLQYENDDDRRISVYVNQVGLRVAQNAQRKAIPYHFYYIPEDGFVNAEALPGGQIVIGRGLLRLLDTEDELASILGHEITHVDRRHSIERVQIELQSRKLGLEDLYALGEPGLRLFEAGYTKEQELEADRGGLELAVAAGYSPQGGVDAMKRLAELEGQPTPANSPEEELAQVPAQALEEYFRSHPPAAERVAALQKEIAEQGWDATKSQRPLGVLDIFLAARAQELDQQGDFAKSIALYKRAISANPSSAAALLGLTQATWRSGDAAATVQTAKDALAGGSRSIAVWQLLADALAAQDPRDAANALGVEMTHYPDGTTMDITVESLGLRLLGADGDKAFVDFKQLADSSSNALSKDNRERLAWWLYRAGKLQDAEQQLEDLHQSFPMEDQVQAERTWILSDMGRQADALDLAKLAPQNQAEGEAVLAMIEWRASQHEDAQYAFAEAVTADPVWLEPHWAAHNYSPQAAIVLDQLRVAEIARRKKEKEDADKARREAAASH